MEQKVENKKKIIKIAIWVVVILALMGTMHILVNYFNFVDVIKAIHGG
jgi:flagellar basal body-associated protein FliL